MQGCALLCMVMAAVAVPFLIFLGSLCMQESRTPKVCTNSGAGPHRLVYLLCTLVSILVYLVNKIVYKFKNAITCYKMLYFSELIMATWFLQTST